MDAQIEPQARARFGSLQKILCCPDTKTPLRLVGIKELCSNLADDERERIPEGTIGAFISEALQRAYPLTERVVNFLKEGSLSVQTASSGTAASILAINPGDDVKRNVREWYDRFGWQTNGQGYYNDTASFAEVTPTGRLVRVDVTPINPRSLSRRRVCARCCKWCRSASRIPRILLVFRESCLR
jgi:uncharacterized protein YbaR (Trm112 family)